MSMFKTLYRVAVMIATGIIVVKGWQLYGPSTEQVKNGASRVVEIAQNALDKSKASGSDPRLQPDDPRTAAPELAEANSSGADGIATESLPAVSSLTPEISPPGLIAEGDTKNPAATDATDAPQLLGEAKQTAPAATGERLPVLMSRLEELGVAEPKLAAWGASGQLYRFCCEAKWGNTANYTRHFESVAAKPESAIEQVVTEVEAWRTAQRGGSGGVR